MTESKDLPQEGQPKISDPLTIANKRIYDDYDTAMDFASAVNFALSKVAAQSSEIVSQIDSDPYVLPWRRRYTSRRVFRTQGEILSQEQVTRRAVWREALQVADLFQAEITPYAIKIRNQPRQRTGVRVRGGVPSVRRDTEGNLWVLPIDEQNGAFETVQVGLKRPAKGYSLQRLRIEVTAPAVEGSSKAKGYGAAAPASEETTKQIAFYPPIFYSISERKGDGSEEHYRMYLVGGLYEEDGKIYRDSSSSPNPNRSGIVVECSEGGRTFYPFQTMRQGGYMVAVRVRKPVIYFYPKKRTQVSVKLDYDGQIIEEYPKRVKDKWEFVASVDGVLEYQGNKYKYLFWEGRPKDYPNSEFTTGFCVARNEVEAFLEEKLTKLGLNFAEKNDFITYWAPILKKNQWSHISFINREYLQSAKMSINPKPDTLIRVFMTFKKIPKKISLPAQKLKSLKRKGFVVVEWGGINLDDSTIK